MVDLASYSFPSGHTMGAMSFYTVLTFFIWRRVDSRRVRGGVLTFSAMMILGMGFSRVYLGVHYATDVLGGFLLSGAIIAFFYWFFQLRSIQK
ncbi:phosphatase PAP2 family protein [Bacillus sp. JCM 19041]|uniref:phosphatase PAP2 family protein n=1 Tax=Bacillus sp. JCM 19041 TaxID=1460637 RepID=UPI0006D16E9B